MTTDLMAQLERYGEVIDGAVAPFDVAELEVERHRPPRLVPPKVQPWRRPSVVVVVAFAGVLAAGLLLWAVARSGGGPSPADEPSRFVPGERAAVEIDPVLGVPFEPVIPFRATIEISDGPSGDALVTETPVLEVIHGGVVTDDSGAPILVGLRVDVVTGFSAEFPAGEELNAEPPEFPPAAGSFVTITDGSAGTYLSDRNLFLRWTEGPFNAGELAWRTWSEYCSVGAIDTGESEVVAARTATRAICSRAGSTFELWIDVEAGVVLRVRRSMADSGPSPLLENLGVFPPDFAVTSIEFHVEADPKGFWPVPPAGSEVIDGDARLRRVLAANPDMTISELIDEPPRPLPGQELVGMQAPELRGPTLDGDLFDLAELRGEPVVVLWWASWCGPSLERLDVLDAAARDRDDVVFAAVTVQDDPTRAKQVATDAEIRIQIVDSSATDPDPSSLWGVEACPVTFHINQDGIVVAVLDVYRSVEELLAQL